MSLAIGTRLGPYAIVASIGAGGMGEVYRAHDARLNRDVALKVLPDAVSSDRERVARFEREAHALATLNHLNIAQIFDVVSDPGTIGSERTYALVMELVPGRTLEERLRAGGTMAAPDALDVARQIAAAVEAAHERGIIHRDLKPANIKVRDDGTVKVLDFGLAKALSSESAPESESAIALSPTRSHRATALGVVLGTAAYMAPEQAKGKPVDRRADIWAFGVVCFEMLSGHRLFDGADASEVLAGVLKADIDWSRLPSTTPPAIIRLLRRCLERDPQRRLRDIGDARLEIEDAIAAPASGATAGAPVRMTASAALARERRWWTIALTAVVAAAIAAIAWLRPAPPAAPREIRLTIPTPTTPAGGIAVLALSPDGRSVVFPATVGGKTQLWMRSLDAEEPRGLPGSEATAGLVSWSSDGRTLNRASEDGLLQYDPVTGTVRAVRRLPLAFGWTMNADGVVLDAAGNAAPLTKVTADGSTAPATRLEAPQASHRFPFFLPDGRHFIFLATGPVETQGIFLGSLDSTASRRLVAADTMAVFAPPDMVVFGREDSLFAQRIDAATFEPVGAPFMVASNLLQIRTVFGLAALASSASGAIAFRHAARPSHQIVWLDRSGKTIGTVGEPETNEWIGPPILSPDGRTIAVARRVNGKTNIWTIENSPHSLYQRLTSNPSTDLAGAWSPDGSQLVFFSSPRGGGTYDLFLRSMTGGNDTPLLASENSTALGDWSRDGRFVLYVLQDHGQVQRDIWALPMQGDRKPFPVSTDPTNEVNPRLSPDGHWVAYQANEVGAAPDVYVRPFPGPGRAWRLSANGGSSPAWSRDGKEIDYLGPDNTVMAVSVNLSASSVEREAPTALFHLRAGSTFMPAPDGQRFLVNSVLEDPTTPPITVILNLAMRRP